MALIFSEVGPIKVILQDSQISAQNAVTASLVDYQQTRLQLLLDIGALDTEAPKFWLKDNLAAYLPGPAPASAKPQQPDSGEQSVLPPDQYFSE